ncbi:MAG TPA: flavodoxin domain-containing protein [Acidimicrobiia bacterium]|jgi:menaquinone-dependent protoporphyrinogen oxidase|nr:flavodoxin domain-containing protein [Acidimicrobiia bacterium]
MATNPPKILVVYHTSEGQTARIAERIASTLRRHGDAVDLHEVEHAPPPEGCDGIVVGDPIHAVKHSRTLIRYLETHEEAIVRREGGDLDTSHDYEYTDRDAVEQFADDVHRVVDLGELA